MTNAVYQAFVQELEKVLPPRVVSRSLKTGLESLNRTPHDVTLEDLESLLHDGPLREQLQAMLPADKAAVALANLLERVRDPEERLLHQTPAFGQKIRTSVAEFKEALRPFNLYFEWPEVQKLRAQVQLIEEGLSQDAGVAELLSDARDQLGLLRQKLEDQLVRQARELNELAEAMEELRGLEDPRVRRFENLVAHINRAQENRTLAAAEIEHARLLSADLRKLPGASPYAATSPGDQPDLDATAELTPEEVTARHRKLDLENDSHRLDQLELQHVNLLALRPQLKDRFAGLRESIAAGNAAGDAITGLEVSLNDEFSRERNTLTKEFAAMAADNLALDTPVGTSQLRQALQVVNGILATTLPDPADLRHVRGLHELAREQLEVMNRTMHDGMPGHDARELAELELDGRFGTLNEIFQLERELIRFPDGLLPELDDLKSTLEHVKSQLENGGTLPDLNDLWLGLEDIRSSLAGRLDSMPGRTAEALDLFGQVERLNSEDVATVRRILQHLSQNMDRFPQLSLALQLQLEGTLSEAEELLRSLRDEFKATQSIADQLVSANILDELLGGGSGGHRPTSAHEPVAGEPVSNQPLLSGNGPLDALLAELKAERGVDQLMLLREDQPLAGSFREGAPALAGALLELERDLGRLGSSLSNGNLELLTMELQRHNLVAAWPAPGYRLLVIVDIPATLSLVLHRIRRQLSSIHGLLNDSPVT